MKPFLALYRHDRGVVLSGWVISKQGRNAVVAGFNTSRCDLCTALIPEHKAASERSTRDEHVGRGTCEEDI